MLVDTNMIVRNPSVGNLEADFTSDAFTLPTKMMRPIFLAVHVPAGGAAMTLDVSVQIDNSGYQDYIKYPQISTAPESTIYIPVMLPDGFNTVKVFLDVGGTTPNFGAVGVSFVLAPRYDL